jgi:acetyl esterase/lipase
VSLFHFLRLSSEILPSFCALTGKDKKYDKNGYENFSSQVQAAVPWYAPSQMSLMPRLHAGFSDLVPLITGDAPPFLLLHGDRDDLVPIQQSELLYEGLQKAGVDSDFFVIKGAAHGDPLLCQEQVRELITGFLREKL